MWGNMEDLHFCDDTEKYQITKLCPFQLLPDRSIKGINNAALLGNIKSNTDLGRWNADPALRNADGSMVHFC